MAPREIPVGNSSGASVWRLKKGGLACRDDLPDGAKRGDDNAVEILLEPGLANAQLSGDQDGFNDYRVLLTQRLLAIDADLVGIDTQLV